MLVRGAHAAPGAAVAFAQCDTDARATCSLVLVSLDARAMRDTGSDDHVARATRGTGFDDHAVRATRGTCYDVRATRGHTPGYAARLEGLHTTTSAGGSTSSRAGRCAISTGRGCADSTGGESAPDDYTWEAWFSSAYCIPRLYASFADSEDGPFCTCRPQLATCHGGGV